MNDKTDEKENLESFQDSLGASSGINFKYNWAGMNSILDIASYRHDIAMLYGIVDFLNISLEFFIY